MSQGKSPRCEVWRVARNGESVCRYPDGNAATKHRPALPTRKSRKLIADQCNQYPKRYRIEPCECVVFDSLDRRSGDRKPCAPAATPEKTALQSIPSRAE